MKRSLREKASTILLRRLKEECDLDIPDGARIKQIRHAEWSWRIADGQYTYLIGSFWPVTTLAKAKGKLIVKDIYGDSEIWIDEKVNKLMGTRAKDK